ncbi:hypothetical protein OQA88_8315 [Cercophora sp. LCS_1]
MSTYHPTSSTSSLTSTAPSLAKPEAEQRPELKEKKSLYARYMDARMGRNKPWNDEDLKKATGMTLAEIVEWGKNRPGVAGNQPAGKLAMGTAMGIGGYETSQGVGGWGRDAEPKMKFSPRQQQKEKTEK